MVSTQLGSAPEKTGASCSLAFSKNNASEQEDRQAEIEGLYLQLGQMVVECVWQKKNHQTSANSQANPVGQ